MRAWLPVAVAVPFVLTGCPQLRSDWTIGGAGDMAVDASSPDGNDGGAGTPAYCGDATCNNGETCSTCATDCNTCSFVGCGDALCDDGAGESCSTCLTDCGACGPLATTANLTINTTSSGANVTNTVSNFPLLVRLNSSNFNFSLPASDASDVRFRTSTGTNLSYQIESWSQASQKAEIWVLVPSVIGNNSTQYIVMSWGNSGGSQSNGPNTFTSGNAWDVVHHMASYTDSTSNNNHLNNGVAPVLATDCVIGSCYDFDGVDDRLLINDSATLDFSGTFTASFWMKWEGSSGNWEYEEIISRKSAYNETTGWELRLRNNNNELDAVAANTSGGEALGTFANWYNATPFWSYITVTFNGNSIQAYENGVAKVAITNSPGAVDNDLAIAIGGNVPLGDNFDEPHFDGCIDELRIHDAVDNPDFIALSYETQKESANTVGVSINGSIQTASNDISLEAECKTTSAGAYSTTRTTPKTGFTGTGYITSSANTPVATVYDGTSADRASYNFAATAGTYNIYFRVDLGANNSTNDSWYYRIDEGAWTRNNGHSGTGWLWIQGAGGQVSLNGAHTLEIANSETGLSIDRIMIRQTSLGAPSGTGGTAYNCAATTVCGDATCSAPSSGDAP